MTRKHMAGISDQGIVPPTLYDRYLFLATISLLAIGLLMVTSASIVISNRIYGQSFHFLFRQLVYLMLGLLLSWGVLCIKIERWEKYSWFLLIASIVLLVLVLVPGIGRQVNGSMRWIGFNFIGGQVSEFVKLAVIIYLAGYLVRRADEVRSNFKGFVKPLIVLAVIIALLLKEPDFGASTVVLVTALGMMFLAGARLWQFAFLLLLAVFIMGMLAVSSPYRLERLTTFLNPWADQFDSGYQLTQSLIAFGRGGWLGVGLGESVQKLFYLPEAHTDFLFAVIAEELGLVGVLAVMGLFAWIVWRGLEIARTAQRLGNHFAAYLAYGLSVWLAIQVMINIGVNAGVLPTKGLTLPLMSYGGSSMLACCLGIAFLLRIDYESRMALLGLANKKAVRRN